MLRYEAAAALSDEISHPSIGAACHRDIGAGSLTRSNSGLEAAARPLLQTPTTPGLALGNENG
jgi:hypothetical protein